MKAILATTLRHARLLDLARLKNMTRAIHDDPDTFQASGHLDRDLHTKEMDAENEAMQVEGTSVLRIVRWERKLRKKVVRVKGNCMQVEEEERSDEAGECRETGRDDQ